MKRKHLLSIVLVVAMIFSNMSFAFAEELEETPVEEQTYIPGNSYVIGEYLFSLDNGGQFFDLNSFMWATKSIGENPNKIYYKKADGKWYELIGDPTMANPIIEVDKEITNKINEVNDNRIEGAPTLTADTSNNDTAHDIEITFEGAYKDSYDEKKSIKEGIEEGNIGVALRTEEGSELETLILDKDKYLIESEIKPAGQGGFYNSEIGTITIKRGALSAGTYDIVVEAFGVKTTSVEQVVEEAEEIAVSSLTANGTSGTTTTTELTLTLAKDVNLVKDDITLTGATLENVTDNDDGTYTLAISNVEVADGENVTVKLLKMGYAFNPASKTVAVNVVPQEVVVGNITADGISGTKTTTKLTFTLEDKFIDLDLDDVKLTKAELRGIIGYHENDKKKYILEINKIKVADGENVTVELSKANYTFKPASQKVAVNVEAAKVPAVVSSAVVENAAPNKIVITMDKALTTVGETTNNATDFTVSGVTGNPTVSKVAVAEKIVTLTLTGNVSNGETVKVSYADTHKVLTSTADGDVAAFSNQAVTNNVEAAKVPAVVSSAVVENAAPNKIVITMDKALTTVGETTNNATDFTVSGVTGNPTVSKVAVAGKTVTLTLTGNISNGETVKVSYADTHKVLTSTADGDVAAFSNQAVTNNVE